MLSKNTELLHLLCFLKWFETCFLLVTLRAADLGLSGQDEFWARTFGRFPTSLFLPLALSSNWILILLQTEDRQNVTHKQTDTVSEIAYFS